MLKLDFFIKSMKEKRYMDRKWVTRCISVLTEKNPPEESYPGLLDGKIQVLIDGETVHLEDATPGASIYGAAEVVVLPVGTLTIIKEETESTYRHCIMNGVMLEYPFGDKFTYQTERFSRDGIDSFIERSLRDKVITLDQYKAVFRSMQFIDFMNDYCVVSSSDTLLLPDPEVLALRDKLVAEHADQLTDPKIMAMISDQLASLIHEKIKDDPAYGFFVKPKKSINRVRRMTHGMVGGVSSPIDPSKVIPITRSLIEGIEPRDIPPLTNNSRGGSQQRAIETQKGGEGAKFDGRLFQNTKNVGGFCGTKVGLPVIITDNNYRKYENMYELGDIENPMSLDYLKGKVGKTILVHSTGTCITEKGNFCAICLGKNLADSKVRLGPQMSGISGVFLGISLSKFHATDLETTKWDKTRLS